MEEKGVAHSKSKEYTVNGARKMGDTLGSRIPDSCLTLSSNSTSHQKELMSGAKLRTSYNENIFLILGMEQHL